MEIVDADHREMSSQVLMEVTTEATGAQWF